LLEGKAVDPYIIWLLENYGLEDYAGKLHDLRRFFRSYRNRKENDPLRLWAERLIKDHAKYCRNRKNDTIIRQHNSFVMRYVYGYSCRDIAKKQILNPRTVPRDIDAVFRDLMVLVYGVDGLRQKPENSDACNEGSDKDCLFKKQLQQKF